MQLSDILGLGDLSYFASKNLQSMPKTLNSLKSPDRNMFGSTRPPPPPPQKLFKLLNN